jgi:hypothetical protein
MTAMPLHIARRPAREIAVSNVIPFPRRWPLMGEAAAPDVPAGVGAAIAAAYGLMMVGFLTFFVGSADNLLALGVDAVYLAMFLGVPALMFGIEHRSRRITWFQFLNKGLVTWTGHVGGREAVAQILTIPFTIAAGIFGVGLIAHLVR